MPGTLAKYALHTLTAALLLLLFFTLTGRGASLFDSFTFTAAQWHNMKTVFVSIFLEALPFILLGSLVSSALHLYVSEDTVRRWLPRSPLLGILYACALGILLPICECGMIPIMRRLIRKGMPVYIGITYILAAPIINPVTYAATSMAFPANPSMAAMRLALAFVVASAVGLVLFRTVRRNPLKADVSIRQAHAHAHDHGHDHVHAHDPDRAHGQHDVHEHDHSRDPARRKAVGVFTHAAEEFVEMGKYLMLGAFLTACVQTFISREDLLTLSGGTFGAHAFMMVFAYVISLCSTSDAFIAASFASTFPPSALLAFLVFGPMIDFKNTLMLMSVFRSRFVAQLIVLVTAAVLVLSLILNKAM
ncbi:permease [Paenibacillus xanthanilyticus]|uniref:Permease n=1 Tax=Paenibacillus xanthanilyticus TaxID=1783531 RepID=A0ABV8JVW6_9BACL